MKKMITVLMFVLCGTMATACIEDGELSPPDATLPTTQPDAGTTVQPDACPTCQPDASTPAAPTLQFTATATSIRLGQTTVLLWNSQNTVNCHASWRSDTLFTSGSAQVSPEATMTFNLTCHGTNGTDVHGSITITVDTTGCENVVCHGMKVYFNSAALNNVDRCIGWDRNGAPTSLAKGYEVNAPDGVCAITCPSKDNDGTTVTPTAQSGVWLKNGTADVPRWYTTGCRHLPGHPINELGKASGGTWDKDCDSSYPTTALSGPPAP